MIHVLGHEAPASGGLAGATQSVQMREEGTPMIKMSIRKAGTIRLTSAAYYCCSA
jgi:hypothetical protein